MSLLISCKSSCHYNMIRDLLGLRNQDTGNLERMGVDYRG